MCNPARYYALAKLREGEHPVAELHIPLSHPVRQHEGVIPCALRGQEVTGVKVTKTHLVIYSKRKPSHDDRL